LFSFAASKLRHLSIQSSHSSNFIITGVSSISNPRNNSLLFITRLHDAQIERLVNLENCVIIIKDDQSNELGHIMDKHLIIPAANPRLEYARILQNILDEKERAKGSYCLATSIGANFEMGSGCIIEKNVVIGDNVQIGHGCIIKSGVVINDNVRIGDYTVLRENSVIGGYGFGFERDADNVPVRIPHLGGVVLGRNVEVGALTTICSGTIDPTIIEDNVKIDDHVHIAHNCRIGRNCLLVACAEISGSVQIGENTWIGPNSCIIDGITIGRNCMVGIGAVVNKPVPDNTIVSGNPAKNLFDIKKERDLNKEILKALKLENS
jgi:UDP-3-O-[3-hydroxymyristoyl] glucosamine N-acyltransferase LpxD